jgi:hypothetical protein
VEIKLPRGYLSPSSINTYMLCGKQFEFKYVLGEKSPPSIEMLVGSAGHEVFEQYYKDKLKGEDPLDAKLSAEFGITVLEEKALEDDIPFTGKAKDNSILELKNTVEPYIEYVAPNIMPEENGIEKEIRYDVAGIPIMGFIDLIRKSNKVEEYHNINNVICDYKFTGKKWNIDKLNNSLQFILYALSTGIKHIEVQNLVKSKTPLSS